MREIIVLEHLSLDGVIQAPGEKEENLSGDFMHGGVDVKLNLTLFARLPFTLLPKTMISGSSSDDCRHHYV